MEVVQNWVGGQKKCTVDLRSDTVTQPSLEMRDVISKAPVGDDVFRDDPTVLMLEKKIAEMSGKEGALFVPSGTMGNLICVLAHCWERGSEVLLGDKSHIQLYEQGGVSQLGGVHPRSLKNKEDGTFSIQEMVDKVREDDPHCPVTRLVAIENSHNKCGGRALPLQWISELSSVCRQHEIPLHCDGARIFNSCVSQGVELETLLGPVQSASICLSKGLGCPVGSLIVGNQEIIGRALRLRKVLGGGMRQCGLLAAAGLYALENMVERLQEDHAHAHTLAQAINQAGQARFTVNMETVETNIVLMWVDPTLALPHQVVEAMESGDLKVRSIQFSSDEVRFVFHCMIGLEETELAVLKVTDVISRFLDQS